MEWVVGLVEDDVCNGAGVYSDIMGLNLEEKDQAFFRLPIESRDWRLCSDQTGLQCRSNQRAIPAQWGIL